MVRPVSIGQLKERPPEDQHISQPTRGSAQPHDNITSAVQEGGGNLLGLHRSGLLDFINSENFGYVKDRQHVAGFQSHRFSKVPEPTEGWRVETLDLVGLLLHKEPVAYVSANLPRMDELKKAPTRPLDRFETTGLEKLRGGEDLVTADASANLRMLGAIRSAEQCVQCHGGQRGDLLGAFPTLSSAFGESQQAGQTFPVLPVPQPRDSAHLNPVAPAFRPPSPRHLRNPP